jgi:flagellar biosynthesis protein FlhA
MKNKNIPMVLLLVSICTLLFNIGMVLNISIKLFPIFLGKNYILWIIILSVISFLQIVIINKGGVRIAEVAARFTLDALPGKQMSNEAEYNSGIINEEELEIRKMELQEDVDFFGSINEVTKPISLISKIIFIFVLGIILVILVLGKTGVVPIMENDIITLTICGIISQLIMLLLMIFISLTVTGRINKK